MVKFVKNGWLSRAVDGVTLGVTSFIGGYALFGLEYARESWTWLSDLLTTQVLPNSLSTYDFPTSVGEAFGLGAIPLAFAIAISIYFKDDDILDNPRQMLLGALGGVIVTVGVIAMGVTPATLQSVGYVSSIVMLALYVLFRRD